MGMDMRYLIAAAFMAAPGGILYAKLMQPECEVPEEEFRGFAEEEEAPANVLDAAAMGASTGMKLALNVGAMLLAFIGLIALINLGIGGIGKMFHHHGWSLQGLLGWVFSPVAMLIGMPEKDVAFGGSLIGQKLVLNEFFAYIDLEAAQSQLAESTKAIATVALCGFANFSSIAILIGGMGGMAPSRRAEIAQLGLRAVLAGTLSNLTSAAIVGLFLVG
jgi:CNT family concentrative nucleoside transporter